MRKNELEEKVKIIKKINSELLKLKFNFSYVGTRYLAETIYMVYCHNNSNYKLLNIYNVIGKKYKKSADTIYCDIKSAINNMFFDLEEDLLIDYFKYSYIYKPTPKEIIFIILTKIL